MDKLTIRLMVFGFVIGFCMFLGVVLANRGVESRQKPVAVETIQKIEPVIAEASKQVKGESDAVNIHDTAKDTALKGKAEAEETRAEISKARGVGRLGNKIGGLLQILAHYGIQGIIALFEVITA